ncbi:helix-turn-helix transcriptional regulator [Lentzea sp. NBRC 105346]|uniref:helix-turn-helix transcriptional regulator n=1 Tax=Lentzea sp. NBRC 105346 TaxID=3032205 RepID=UPI00331E047B
MPSVYRLVLVRRGRFRRRTRAGPVDVDPTFAYLGVPDEEEHFAHPAGGDVCTAIALSAGLWESLRLGARSTVYVDSLVDLAHRRLLVAARSGDHSYLLAERLVGLLGGACGGAVVSSPGDQALVGRARAAVHDDDPGGLLPLAALLGVSPYRLSRVFSREVGVSLTRYRNRVRVGKALDRIEQGEVGLTALAASLGFADQAHLTRTVRSLTGETPSGLRRLLVR